MGRTCAHEGELVAMKAKIVDFWLKPVGSTLRKGWKITSGGTCAHEGEVVAMKPKIVESWLKPVGGTARKKLENFKWGNLYPWRRTCGHEG